MAMKPLCSPLAALLSACCCAALALALPHYHPASPHCFPAPAPETFAFSPLADNITIPLAGDLSLTVFRQLSFLLLPNSSFSSSFTLTFNQTLTDAPFIQPAGLFLLFLPPPSSPSLSASSAPPPPPASAFDIQVCFVCVEQNASSQIYFPPICNSTQIGVEMNVSLVLGGDPQLGEGLFKDELSLQYAAATGELHLTAAQYGQDEVVTIDLSLSNLDADAGNESTRLLVGYLAETEAIITVQAANDTDAAAPSTELSSCSFRLSDEQEAYKTDMDNKCHCRGCLGSVGDSCPGDGDEKKAQSGGCPVTCSTDSHPFRGLRGAHDEKSLSGCA